MCLAVIAVTAHPRYALVVAANRDEFHERPTSAAHWWPQGLLAGRDERAGGTWFGINRRGRFAFVTNVREPGRNDPAAPSRGQLVPAILDDPADVAVACASVMRDADRYNGFNLIAGDMSSARHVSNRYAGSAAFRHARAWRVERRARRAVAEGRAHARRARALVPRRRRRSRRRCGRRWPTAQMFADALLPATGVSRERERMLSAAFIVDPSYGTRASTLVTIAHNGTATFVERSFDARGKPSGDVTQRFAVEAPS